MAITGSNSVFLAGASRGVGREIAQLLVAENTKVKALLRSPDTRLELESLGINVVLGDAFKSGELELVLRENDSISTVISTIGGFPQQGERVDFIGNKNLIDVAVKAGVQRFILVTSIGSGNSRVALPPQVLETLGAVLAEKEKAEQYLINSGLIYTIIRPGGLKSEPPTGNGVLTEDHRVSGTIHRADVAQLVCRCLQSHLSHRKIFSAVDRNMFYGQPELSEFLL